MDYQGAQGNFGGNGHTILILMTFHSAKACQNFVILYLQRYFKNEQTSVYTTEIYAAV